VYDGRPDEYEMPEACVRAMPSDRRWPFRVFCGLVLSMLSICPSHDSRAERGVDATCVAGYDGPPESLFPSFPDADTVLLWTFDDPEYPYATLTDAGGNEYDLRLMDGGDLGPGVYGTALHVASRPGYEVSFAGWQGAISNERMREEDGVPSGEWSPTVVPKHLIDTFVCGVWTIELRVRLTDAPTEEAALLDMGDAYDPGIAVVIEAGGQRWRFVNHYSGQQIVLGDTSTVLDGDWHHVALVHESGKTAAFIDGRRLRHTTMSAVARQPVPAFLPPDSPGRDNRGFTADSSHEWRRRHRFNLSLGEDRRKRSELGGAIDELRVSKIARYHGEFDDPGSLSRNYGPGAPIAEQPSGPPLLFGPAETNGPAALGSRKHLFVDMALIDSHESVRMKVNSLTSTERLQIKDPSGWSDLVPDGSRWRESVIDHDGKVLLFVSDGYSAERGATWLFESEDGLHFSRPALGVIDDAPEPNLILDRKPWGSVAFKDPNPGAGPESRFKVSSFTSNRGIYLYHSPDAVHWRRNEVAMLPLSVGGDAQVFWDDQRGVYFAHMKRSSDAPSKQGPPGRATVMFMTDEPSKAWPFNKLDNPHFESWPFPLLSDEGTTVVQPRVPVELAGAPGRLEEVYRPQALKYEWAPDVYLAMPHRSFYEGERQHTSSELAVSRDGERWTDYPHNVNGWYMPPFGEIEESAVTEGLSLYGMIRRGDELWVYVEYTTDGAPNGQDGPKRYVRLRQKLDRFVAISAERLAGWVVTRPLVFEGNELEINVDAAFGTLKIAVLDQVGYEIPGFTLAEFDAVHQDDTVRHRASWQGNASLGSLAGKPVRLKFWLDDAKLYAMQFVQ